MKEKEIRQFIHDNMPQVRGSEAFMAELVRQIELLPIPASLSGRTEEEKQADIQAIMSVVRSIKRRNRLTAVAFGAGAIAILAALTATVFTVPVIRDFVLGNYLYIAIAFTAAVLVCAFAFLLNGSNILSSSFFTSLGDARTSVLVSLQRGLLFVVLGIMIYPLILGDNGVWLTVPLAEFFTFVSTIYLLRKRLKKWSVSIHA